MRESQSKIERAYALEKLGGFDGNGTPESREFIRQQLGRGAQMLLNLWYTAWIDSAKEPESRHGEKREPRLCNRIQLERWLSPPGNNPCMN